jgi:hypothetical protein
VTDVEGAQRAGEGVKGCRQPTGPRRGGGRGHPGRCEGCRHTRRGAKGKIERKGDAISNCPRASSGGIHTRAMRRLAQTEMGKGGTRVGEGSVPCSRRERGRQDGSPGCQGRLGEGQGPPAGRTSDPPLVRRPPLSESGRGGRRGQGRPFGTCGQRVGEEGRGLRTAGSPGS